MCLCNVKWYIIILIAVWSEEHTRDIVLILSLLNIYPYEGLNVYVTNTEFTLLCSSCPNHYA